MRRWAEAGFRNVKWVCAGDRSMGCGMGVGFLVGVSRSESRWVHRLFFFSSRRRHTRWPRDWSSDVCSSDLRRRLIEASVTFLSERPGRGSVFVLVGDRLLEELQPTSLFYLSLRGDFRAESNV